MAYKYDFALSFAGEQRREVQAVAALLKESGATVFFDESEKADLWGKDLYQHLGIVYSERARFCILFASKEYAEKVWTNHELKSAQARALNEKGTEYILPVRFDQTKIPGLAPTVSYLEYSVEGAEGIARLALEKIGRSVHRPPEEPIVLAAVAAPASFLRVDHSTRAYIECSNPRLSLIAKVIDSDWGKKIVLTVRPDNAFEEAQLTKLRSATERVIVAFGYDVAVAAVESGSRQLRDGRALWSFVFNPLTTSFRNQYEYGIGGTTSDQFAQQRAERLLLDQHPPPDLNRSNMLGTLNSSMVESAVRGNNALTEVNEGAAPKLWAELKSDPELFLEFFWQRSIAQLVLSNTVEFVDHFSASLNINVLEVDFSGQRHKAYSNQEPFRITVEGRLQLP